MGDFIRVFTSMPDGAGPCVKQTVTATVMATNGDLYIATSHCMRPQVICPRAEMPTGEGYHLCRDICLQPAHAELNALAFAGMRAIGAKLIVEGHTYACNSCEVGARAAGVVTLVVNGQENALEN